MANSLGTLTLDLIAKIGAFTGPLDKASRESKKRTAEIAKSFDSLAKGVGAAVGSLPAVLTALVVHSASVAKEISNQAALAGLGTTEFQKYTAGAQSVGIQQDKLADIFKDTNDKLGDFANTGGGALKDFFTNIAPKVGVTADSFKKLNSKDALALYVTSLEKANVNQQEMTFYMEAIASDSTALVPLLRNGGKAFDELGASAEAAGVILDEGTIAAAKQFGIEVQGLEQYLTSAKTMLAAEFLPVLAQFTKDINSSAKQAGGLKGVVGDLGEKLVESTAFVVNAGDGVVRVFDIVANTLVGLFATAVGHTDNLAAQANAALGALTFGQTSKEFKQNAADFANSAQVQFGVAAQAAGKIREDLETPLAGDKFKTYVANAKAAAAELAKTSLSVTPGTGSGVDPAAIAAAAAAAKKAASDAAAAAKKIQDSFKDSETDLQRQIELINTSVDARKNATEVAKVQFEIESGKLVGINADQQKRLLGLAAELDAKKKLKQANEDEAKAAAYAATLDAANRTAKSGFDQEIAGIGLGDKARDRLKQDLAIREDYNQQMADLQKQFNTGDLSPENFKKQTGQLKAALAERLAIQQDYYTGLDQAQADWTNGATAALADYLDSAQDVAGQTKGLFTSVFTGLEDEVSSFVVNGKASFADFTKSVLADLAKIAARQAASGLLSAGVSAIGGLFGGSGAAGSSQSDYTGTAFANWTKTQAKGGAWLDGIQMFAKGGAFTNGLVSSPTAFGMAGGNLGLMGEAGPEAILPLSRTSDGSLGVKAIGGGGAASSTQVLIQQTIAVPDSGGGASTQDVQAVGQAYADTAKRGAQQAIAEELRPGGAIWRVINGR
ncbi:phage tail tape measure protein [Pseudomonas sp. GD03842]|uniref:phage tail tape measure protein n=1 Tax=Pseudomonas sp. GD03842 TaxID=2975385 RepID=UPI00244B1572|nr:phage tail tape measure protein [Pseudomonas sp. GD03842]MDH0745295.1 phage tail tape measure protein [Pseudomonas sp. GD03842]